MLYHLLYQLHTTYSGFNVFRYITFRAAMAALMALVVSFLLGPWLIRSLTAKQMGQQIRDDGPASHSTKAGTPTMGGTPDYLALSSLHPYSSRTSRIPIFCSRWRAQLDLASSVFSTTI